MTRAIAIVVALLVAVPSRPVAARARTGDATAIALQADAAHEAGRFGEAGELYARAYRAMNAEEKMALGEVMVAAALDDLRSSHRAAPDPDRTRLAGELLAEYEREVGTLPDAIAEHRAWLPTEETPALVEDEVLHDPAPTRRQTYDDDEPAPRTIERRAAPRDVAAPLSIGFGVAATIGGAALLAFGAPLGKRAEDARDDALADPRYLALHDNDPETIAYEQGYDDYVEHEKRRATAFAVTGSLLLAAGIGLAVYGAIRLARHRRAPSEMARVRAIPGGLVF